MESKKGSPKWVTISMVSISLAALVKGIRILRFLFSRAEEQKWFHQKGVSFKSQTEVEKERTVFDFLFLGFILVNEDISAFSAEQYLQGQNTYFKKFPRDFQFLTTYLFSLGILFIWTNMYELPCPRYTSGAMLDAAGQ